MGCDTDHTKIRDALSYHSNSIKDRPAEQEGKLITNKQNHQLHGYGIKSVQKIVRKYEGDFSYQIRESEFIVTITFWRLEERNEI